MRVRIVYLIVIILFISSLANAQEMKNLYEYVINDHCNDLRTNKYISTQDTVYFTCSFWDCENKCYDYDVELKDEKVRFYLPTLNNLDSTAAIYSLSTPELLKQSIIINVGLYVMRYVKDKETEFVYSGTIQYVFQYSRRKYQYVFKSKKMYGV